MERLMNAQGAREYQDPMSVGPVAKVCQVSKKTVLNWIYQKKLKAYTLPGGHYRIWPGDLKKFILKEGMDVSFAFSEKRYKTILIVGYETDSEAQLKAVINRYTNKSEIICSHNLTEALLTTGDKKPALIALNWGTRALSTDEVDALLSWQKKYPCKLVLSSSDGNQISVMRNMFQFAEPGQVTSCSLVEAIKKISELLQA